MSIDLPSKSHELFRKEFVNILGTFYEHGFFIKIS